MGFFDSFKTGFGTVLGQVGASLLGSAAQAGLGALFGTGQANVFQQPGVNPGFNTGLLQQTALQQQLQQQAILNQQLLLGQAASQPSFANPFFSPGGGGQGFGFGSIGQPAGVPFGTLGAQQVAFPTTLGVGFPQATQAGFGGLLQSLGQSTGLGLPFVDVVPQGVGSLGLAGSGLMNPFRRTLAGAAAQPFIASNPVTGRSTWFKPAGRPILWSGDLTACKRVNKIARRARRAKR